MKLQPLFDLKERLEYGAIAGTGLLQEDFRLRRAAEGMTTLAAASPVFKKISGSVDALLAAPAHERGALLLDALGLVNAVVYTQGITGISGELEEFSPGGGAYVQASYGQLQPLITALSSTGSGRMAVIQSHWEEHPDYFGDFRVLPHVIAALGDNYGELSDLMATILCKQGKGVVPLLQKGFDPAGKREMVRRVQVLEAVAGAKANGFYLAQLERAEKDIRAALIYALRHEEGNGERLVELCRTERGGGKRAAHWALAKLESPVAWTYWDAMAAKNPIQAAVYMTLSTSAKASVLVANAFDRILSIYETDPTAPLEMSVMGDIQTLLLALPGKSGEDICRIYRRMAALGTSLDNKGYEGVNRQTMAVRFKPTPETMDRGALPFSRVVPQVLRRSILFHPAPDLLALAEELGQISGYQLPALTAALLSKPAAEALSMAEPLLKPAGLLQKKRSKDSSAMLGAVLAALRWDGESGSLAYQASFTDSAGHRVYVVRPVREPLDDRWFQYLTTPGWDIATDMRLAYLLTPGDDVTRQRVGNYLYQRALVVKDNRPYLPWLRSCGLADCRGLLEAYCKRHKANTWEFVSLLEGLPGTPEAVVHEAERVLALIQEKKIAVGGWNPAYIEKWIAQRRGHTT